MTWDGWYSTDRAWLFSRERTHANACYLAEVLSADFIQFAGRVRSVHPLLQMWDNPGPASLLSLNALAEDIRIVEKKPDAEVVLHDLRNPDTCLAAWHTLRAAALLERAHGGRVTEFVKALNETAPDFIVDFEGLRVPVEAKLLMMSMIEEEFHRVAEETTRAIIELLKGKAEGFGVTVVLKGQPASTLTAALVSAIAELVAHWDGAPRTARTDQFNVRVEVPGLSAGMIENRLLHILMPVPSDEVIRVKSRARHASAQLRSQPDAARSGLLALGLTDRHDGTQVFATLDSAMRAGRYRGIAATLLMKSGLQLRPPVNTVVDLAEIRFNPRAEVPLNANIPLRGVGHMAVLTKAEPTHLDVPAYRHLLASGKPAAGGREGGGAFLGLNDVPRVAKDLLP